MRIIRPSEFKTMPWKNGGGITHEILKEERVGRLLWRLSIAEVASDGPFSLFPGLSRILTVVDGAGLELATPDKVIRAPPLRPVSFSGDWPVVSRRVRGDVRDFNVIFDATVVSARVTVHDGLKIPGGGDPARFVLALKDVTTDGLPVSTHSLVALDEAAVIEGKCLQVILLER